MRKTLIALLALACLTVVTRTAESAPIGIWLLDSNGNSSGIIVDGAAGDTDATNGIVGFSGAVGDWAVNTTAGGWFDGTMQLFSLDLSARTTSTLYVLFTSVGNTAPNSGFDLFFATALQNATASYGAFGDSTNTPFSLATGIGGFGPFAGGSSLATFSDRALAVSNLIGPYSLTQLFVVTGTGGEGSIFVGQGSMQAVPEPASMLLLGTGVLALGRKVARRRPPTSLDRR